MNTGRCEQCNIVYINGVRCHEKGCPLEWKDYLVDCKECGFEFQPTERGQKFCSTCCAASHYGMECGCDLCRQTLDEGE